MVFLETPTSLFITTFTDVEIILLADEAVVEERWAGVEAEIAVVQRLLHALQGFHIVLGGRSAHAVEHGPDMRSSVIDGDFFHGCRRGLEPFVAAQSAKLAAL